MDNHGEAKRRGTFEKNSEGAIDWSQPAYISGNCERVVLITTQAPGSKPVVAYVPSIDKVFAWRHDGKYVSDFGIIEEASLVNGSFTQSD